MEAAPGGITVDDVDYVELSADGDSELDTRELKELAGVFQAQKTSTKKNKQNKFSSSTKTVAVGTVKANVGHVGYASGAAALIKAALCLHNRYLPSLPNWEGPKKAHVRAWNESSFYVSDSSRAWVKNKGDRRHCAVSGVAVDGNSCFNVVLSDLEGCHESQTMMSQNPKAAKLVVIRAANAQGLLKTIASLRQRCADSEQASLVFGDLLRATVEDEQLPPQQCATLCLVTTPKKLQKELHAAEKGISRCTDSSTPNKEWNSPTGSYFTASPLNSDRIAFVYGDGASPYYGLGRNLNRLVPSLHEVVNEKTTDMWTEGDKAWYARETDTESSLKVAASFADNTVDMFRSGVYHSVCHTEIATRVLGIKPKAAFGLSMGEVAMLFAFSDNNSKQSDEMTRRLRFACVVRDGL